MSTELCSIKYISKIAGLKFCVVKPTIKIQTGSDPWSDSSVGCVAIKESCEYYSHPTEKKAIFLPNG